MPAKTQEATKKQEAARKQDAAPEQTRESTQELIEKRDSLLEKAKTFVADIDTREKNKGQMSTEEQATFDAMNRSIEQLITQIGETQSASESRSSFESAKERISAMEERANAQHERAQKRLLDMAHQANTFASAESANSEERAAFRTYLRTGSTRDLVTSNPQKGGVLIPSSLHPEIITKVTANSALRKIAHSQLLNEDRDIPIQTGEGTTTLVDEGEEAQEDTGISFGSRTLRAHKFVHRISLSVEMLNDSAYNIEQFLYTAAGKSIAKQEERSFLHGGGAKGPRSLLADVLKRESKTTNAVTGDDLLYMLDGIASAYQSVGTWVMNQATRNSIRLLKSGDGKYIYDPSLELTVRDTLLGRPVVISDAMPVIAKENISILFGDFSNYHIATRSDISTLSDPYTLLARGLVMFHTTLRSDAVLTMPEAIIGLQIK